MKYDIKLTVFGAWRSLVAHLLWEQGVGGSNPLAPTSLRFETEWRCEGCRADLSRRSLDEDGSNWRRRATLTVIYLSYGSARLLIATEFH